MISLEVNGLDEFRNYFETAPDRTKKAASLALNQIGTRFIVPRSRDLIAEQINFPSGYVNKDRLEVTQPASPNHLELIVKGRDRPTSLLRFAALGATMANGTQAIASVQVKPGTSKPIRRGFAINLRSGNRGFAVRLRAGESLGGSQAAVRIAPNLYLLYGPSVNQAFLSVADKLTPEFLDRLSDEFLRQFTRDNL